MKLLGAPIDKGLSVPINAEVNILNSLVLDLQQELMNPDFDLMISLRKAHIIASKLKLKEFDCWIQTELNGYMEKDNIPDYRAVSGRIMARHPTYGWIPVMLVDRGQETYFSSKKVANPIAELLESRKKLNGQFVIIYSGEEQTYLKCEFKFSNCYSVRFAYHCESGQIYCGKNSKLPVGVDNKA